MLFGLFVYSFQGQFTLPLAFQGMSTFAWQTVGNVIALITATIAAGLYGNIGISAYGSLVSSDFSPTPMSFLHFCFRTRIASRGLEWKEGCSASPRDFFLAAGNTSLICFFLLFSEVAYYNIVEQWFKGPPIMSKKGRIVWTCECRSLCLSFANYHYPT